ncbi:substrate-binding domain-containing protein [Actinotalea sp. M2MS4P-6]|uniref:substrate-binding domain-containing protein n=1 Tax=Actinotalea sp. M2MS4P-6 TaxID=2983762 RepID=UPI0021E4AB24|nr:substrate-binding domain-containing protein [Actinotalea sp. M2MS4P-6]MCV2395897.1 substrate-binding domain-containing protein [Actinotalea sp. M2MS4P-6]
MTTRTWSRTRSTAVAVVGATALLVSLTACDSGQEAPADAAGTSAAGDAGGSGPLEIVYLQKQGDQQYFVDEADGAKAAAEAAGDVTVTVVNLGTDSNKAISELDAAIARGVDGIIMVAPDQAIGPQVIEKANAAGIPLLASDDILTDADGNEAPFVGFDGTSMGNEVGTKAAELYQAAGWTAADTAIIAVGKPDLSVCVQRLEGAADTFGQGASDAPEILDLGTDNSVTDALNKAGGLITAHQDVQHWVVWGCNDESETGVVTALQNAGVSPDSIIGVGLGAYLTCKDWKAGQDTGNKAALYISGYDVGSAALDAMVADLRDGTPLPPKTIAATHMVDASNWEAEGVTCT